MTVEITAYDPCWPERAAAVARELMNALPGGFARIEHIGSTSVPGLAAKPIIDLMAGVADLEAAAAELPVALVPLRFSAEDNGMSGRLFFHRDEDGRRAYHLHVVPEATSSTRKEVLMRDLLRRRPDHAERYAALKRLLAASHPDDGSAYTVGKTDMIQQFVDEARAAAGLEPIPVWEG